MADVIAFLSGKGGTGKSAISAAVACALAREGKTVLSIDCDAQLRNLDIFLGMGDMDALSFQDVASGAYGRDCAVCHPELENLRFLTAPVNIGWAGTEEKAFGKLLEKAKKKFQYVLLDCPAGLERGFYLPAKYADTCILITDSQPASLRGTAQAVQILEKMEKKDIRMIVNRVDVRQLAKRKITVDDIMDETGACLLGVVPEDGAVQAGEIAGCILPESKKGAYAACRRIARRLIGLREPIGL